MTRNAAELKRLFRIADDLHPVTRRKHRQPVDINAYQAALRAFTGALRAQSPELPGWRWYDSGTLTYVQLAGQADLLDW